MRIRALCLFRINICWVNTKFEIAITVKTIENPSFYSDIRRFGWPSYTSVVVINVWLCCLTGYALRIRKKNNVLIIHVEVQNSIAAVRQQDVLKSLWR